MEDHLTIRGSLEESALPELLRSVYKSKESGVLTCFIQECRKSIYIHEGQIIFATSTNFDDRLGESLIRYGKITIRHFLDATKNVRPDKRLGAILCESGYLPAEDLVEGVRAQVRDIILSLFHITRGPYELVLKNVDTHEMILLNESTDQIIFDGIKSIQSWSRISKGIGSFSSRLLPAQEAEKILFHLELTPEESHLFSLCAKAQFNVEEICGVSYLSNFETCRTLWALMMVGALEPVDASLEKLSEADRNAPSSLDFESDLHDLVENYNDLYSHIYEFVFQRLGEQADDLAGKAMTHVQLAMPNVAKDLTLDMYGRLDFDAILKNLAP
ncbi:MAG TPA: DUF4388 domain-containing protein, partial [Acidobacteriota bacterium]|nr:DUF4388 domain-containing protein [Acidobacteriota bacterium]